ncbi:MAG: hypothetical protein H8D34_26380, partial [Chloroflexi bacterium]|nr:hypothetical protein [Chloroflexota bacterium]
MQTNTITHADFIGCIKFNRVLRTLLFVVLVFVMALSWTSVVYADGGDTEGTDVVQTSDTDQAVGDSSTGDEGAQLPEDELLHNGGSAAGESNSENVGDTEAQPETSEPVGDSENEADTVFDTQVENDDTAGFEEVPESEDTNTDERTHSEAATTADDLIQPIEVTDDVVDNSLIVSCDENVESDTEVSDTDPCSESEDALLDDGAESEIILDAEIIVDAEDNIEAEDELEESEPTQTEVESTEIVVPDPYFFVSGTKHSFLPSSGDCAGDANCAVSTTPIQDAINAVAGGLTPDDGTIYIEGGDYAENILIEGLSSLVLQGAADEQPTTLSGLVTIRDSLSIGLRDFTFSQTITIDNSTDVQIVGTAGDDTLDVTLSGTGTSEVSVDGDDGDDQINIHGDAGEAGEVNVDGGAGADKVILVQPVDAKNELNIAAETLEINGGIYSPGNSPGILNVSELTVSAGGTLQIEIGGTAVGTEYDQFNVAGLLTLDGTLDVSLINGFSPAVGDTFDILTFGSISGQFADATGLFGFSSAGDYFDINEGVSQLQLEVAEFPGPELTFYAETPEQYEPLGMVLNGDYFASTPSVEVTAGMTLDDGVSFSGTFTFEAQQVSGVDIATGFDTDITQIADTVLSAAAKASLQGLNLSADSAYIDDVNMLALNITGAAVDGFFGWGDVDLSAGFSDQDLTGLLFDNLELGLVIMIPMWGVLPGIPDMSFAAALGTSTDVDVTGFGGLMEFAADSATLHFNTGTRWAADLDQAVVDFSKSFESVAGAADGIYQVSSGALGPYDLGSDGDRKLAANLSTAAITILDLLDLRGDFGFEIGPTQVVDLDTGVPANLAQLADNADAIDAIAAAGGLTISQDYSRLSGLSVDSFFITGGGVSGFMGFGDAQFDAQTNAITNGDDLTGFGFENLNIAVGIFTPTIDALSDLGLPDFLAIKGEAQTVSTFGFGEMMRIEGQGITIAMNQNVRLDGGFSIPDLSLPNFTLPTIDLPDLWLPDLELPSISLPTIDLPSINIPGLGITGFDLPIISLPDLIFPAIDLPNFSLPSIDLGNINFDISLPDLSLLSISLPSLSLPTIDLSGLTIPDWQLPVLSLPVLSIPDLQLSISLPDITIPALDLTGLTLPDIVLPDLELPDLQLTLSLPDLDLSAYGLPNLSLPDLVLPLIDLPTTSLPDIVLPDVDL